MKVLFAVDNCLFMFECKKSFFSCNLFEFITTSDYSQKAADQLRNFQNLWQPKPLRTYWLTKKIKTKNHLPSPLPSCMVTKN